MTRARAGAKGQPGRHVAKARFNSAGSCESDFGWGFCIGYVPDRHRHPTRWEAPCPSPLQPITNWELLLEIPRPAALLFRGAGTRSPRFQRSLCKTCFPFLGHLTGNQTGRSCHPALGIWTQHRAQKNLMSLGWMALRRESIFHNALSCTSGTHKKPSAPDLKPEYGLGHPSLSSQRDGSPSRRLSRAQQTTEGYDTITSSEVPSNATV